MREIIFRGKRIDNSEWVDGDLLNHDNRVGMHNQLGDGTMNVIDIDPETVGQYTGLKDKNGKRIFEGDIVNIDDDWDEYGWAAGEKGVIYFENGQFKLKTKVSIFVTDYAFKVGATVLGNIHDNPGLINGSK